jgi:hypothetical protein
MNKHIATLLATITQLASITSLAAPLASQTTARMLFMGENRGVKVYIDPQKIIRRSPFVRFWVYAVLPRPNSRRVSSLDTMMGIDCTIGSVRIYEIIRYDSNGEIVSNSRFGMERSPDNLETVSYTHLTLPTKA